MAPVSERFELRGQSVILRELTETDHDAFVVWASDSGMYTYMAWKLENSAAAEKEFERLLAHPERSNPERRHWYLAVDTSDGDFCGLTGFDLRRDGLGEFGWYLASPWWGRGYATEATALLLRFGFDALNVPAVTATCDPENGASRRVLEKNGLAMVGEEQVSTWRGPRSRLRFQLSAEDHRRTK